MKLTLTKYGIFQPFFHANAILQSAKIDAYCKYVTFGKAGIKHSGLINLSAN